MLVATPTYCERDNIEEFLERTRRAVPDADVLVIDDRSPDGTADVVEAVGVRLGRIHVLRRGVKQGLGTAYRAGFEYALERGYDIVCCLDADLSHDPAVLPTLIGRLADDDLDLVIGSRYVPGGTIPSWTWIRRAVSRFGNLYARVALGLPVRDSTSGYRAYRTTALRAAHGTTTRANGYAFQVEMAYRIWRLRRRVAEVPIAFVDRMRGDSKMSFRIAGEALVLVTWWAVVDRGAALARRWRRE